MHAPYHYFSIGVLFKRISPSSTYVSALNQHSGNMYDMTANCFFNHEGFHWAWLPCPHCQFVLPRKRKNPPACLKWNGLISEIPEPSESWEIVFTDLSLSCIMQTRSKSVRYTLQKIFYTLNILDISIVHVHPCGALFLFVIRATFRYW